MIAYLTGQLKSGIKELNGWTSKIDPNWTWVKRGYDKKRKNFKCTRQNKQRVHIRVSNYKIQLDQLKRESTSPTVEQKHARKNGSRSLGKDNR